MVTEGVFSMDGDSAPLAELAEAETRQSAGGWLLVDDAHGIGVMGEEGRGSGMPAAGEAGTADCHLWQRLWRQRRRRAVQRVRRRLSAAVRPASDLQHQHAAGAGRGAVCVAGGDPAGRGGWNAPAAGRAYLPLPPGTGGAALPQSRFAERHPAGDCR